MSSRMLGWTGHALGIREVPLAFSPGNAAEGWRWPRINDFVVSNFGIFAINIKWKWISSEGAELKELNDSCYAFICPSESKFVFVIKYADISPSPAHGEVCSADMKVYLTGKLSWKCFRSYQLRPVTAYDLILLQASSRQDLHCICSSTEVLSS